MRGAGKIQYLLLSNRNIGKLGALKVIYNAAPGETVAYSDDDGATWTVGATTCREEAPHMSARLRSAPEHAPAQLVEALVEGVDGVLLGRLEQLQLGQRDGGEPGVHRGHQGRDRAAEPGAGEEGNAFLLGRQPDYAHGTVPLAEPDQLRVPRVGHDRHTATGEVRRSFNGNYSPLYQVGYMMGWAVDYPLGSVDIKDAISFGGVLGIRRPFGNLIELQYTMASSDVTLKPYTGISENLGAMTTHSAVARSAEVQKAIPALAELAGEQYEPELEVDLFSLLTAFKAVVERARQKPKLYLPGEQIPIEVRIEQLLARLHAAPRAGQRGEEIKFHRREHKEFVAQQRRAGRGGSGQPGPVRH